MEKTFSVGSRLRWVAKEGDEDPTSEGTITRVFQHGETDWIEIKWDDGQSAQVRVGYPESFWERIERIEVTDETTP